MSRPENQRRIRITEGPAILDMTEDHLNLSQGGNAIAFSDLQDFMAFVGRVGILAVRLHQTLNPPPGQEPNSGPNETPPA